MKKVILKEETEQVIEFSNIEMGKAIFVKKDGKLYGLVVKEPSGWIVRTGGIKGAYGHWGTEEELIKRGIKKGYEFFVEE